MTNFIYALISAFVVSLLALLGITTLAIKEKLINKILLYLVSFSAGGLIGSAFFHLIPEGLESNDNVILVFVYVIIGFCLFFLLERFLRWHHCHDKKCDSPVHLGYLNLVGDAMHNLIDGIIIVSTYLVNPELGFVVTLSIIFHEIPQELGDFGLLLYSGMKKTKALLLNYAVATLTVFGVIIGYFLIRFSVDISIFLVPAAAGGFIYIAASDIIPELHKETKTKKAIFHFITFILALVLMLLLKIFAV